MERLFTGGVGADLQGVGLSLIYVVTDSPLSQIERTQLNSRKMLMAKCHEIRV